MRKIAFALLLCLALGLSLAVRAQFDQPPDTFFDIRQAWLLDSSASVDQRKWRLEIAKYQAQLETDLARLRYEREQGGVTEVAKLIVDLLKSLAWPAVALFLLWHFRLHIGSILDNFSNRLQTAETLKVGVLGQEVQLSGTAKELIQEHELLVGSGRVPPTSEKAAAIEAATRELKNPIADIIGMLLLTAKTRVPLEALTKHLLQTLSPQQGTTEQAPFVIVMMSKQIEKMLSSLQSLGYVDYRDEAYALTDSGREFFTRVQDKFGSFLAKFKAIP